MKIKFNERLGRILSTVMLPQFQEAGIWLKTPDGIIHNLDRQNTRTDLTLTVNRWSFFCDLLLGYDLGFAEAYIKGKWHCNDLPGLFKHLSKSAPNKSFSKIANYFPTKIKARFRQKIRSSNNLKWARRNIEDHYDLSNDFFSLFLDPSMTYSSGIYGNARDDLEVAQELKFHTLLENCNIKSGDHILDIGCGWGSLAVKAMQDYDCSITGVTLSKNQQRYASDLKKYDNRLGKAEFQLVDYRNLEGKFNHIFSIEMLEAVGHKGMNEFFAKCHQILGNNGTIQIQVITIPDDHYEVYRKNCDFIQKHIFPGGMLPSLRTIKKSAKDNGFEIVKIKSLREDYIETLRAWKNNLSLNWESPANNAFDISDYRKFEYYFSYCEGGFDSGNIDNYQISFMRY